MMMEGLTMAKSTKKAAKPKLKTYRVTASCDLEQACRIITELNKSGGRLINMTKDGFGSDADVI